MDPRSIKCVVPSRVGVGETFPLKIKLLGEVREVPPNCWWGNKHKPNLHSPYNLNTTRGIRFLDDVLPEWQGPLTIDAGDALEGPGDVVFDGENQGVYEKDVRPVKTFDGFSLKRPGFHFIAVTDPASGVSTVSNPVYVTEKAPSERIVWGDPHWQTYFSDGLRCPEELYAFARDEAFLDFGAISDHVEALTERQWEYFVAVTNDYNEPERFATLVGLEWTHHVKEGGAPGHRNVYYRGDHGPILRSNDADCDTLDKLWARLDALPANVEAVAIPHHPANVTMGVKWELGWNEKYEKAVEIYSIWGNSEKSEADGNLRPITSSGGEMDGRHIIDALKMGYKMGFVGGGDVHDGRPGEAMHYASYPAGQASGYKQGFTAAMVPTLTRENVFDAIKNRRTYATTHSRIYLDVQIENGACDFITASESGIKNAAIVVNGADAARFAPDGDERIIEKPGEPVALGENDFAYVRVTTNDGDMAWSSPVFG